jgi:hypothetical protein
MPAVEPLTPAICAAAKPPPVNQAPPSPPAAEQTFDYSAIVAAQDKCPDIKTMQASPSLRIVSHPVGNTQLLVDFSTGVFRPLLPAAYRAPPSPRCTTCITQA